jgi:hypothetical protein
MISTLFMLWLIGLAIVLVLKKNPNRATWVDTAYDIIYLPVLNFLQLMLNKFRKNDGNQNPRSPAAPNPAWINSSPNAETVDLQFESKDGRWVTNNSIAGPTNAQVITTSLDSLLRQKAGTPDYAGRVRAIGSVSGQIYEIR